MACNRICRVNIHMDTMSTRVISALQIICLCGSGWLCPHHVLQLTVTLSFFVTDKSSVWGGSFWPISRSPIKRNSEFFMYRALFSYPIFCDVFRIGVLGLEIVLAHLAYGGIHTVLFIFQGAWHIVAKLWGQCSNFLSPIYLIENAEFVPGFQFFWKFWNIPLCR